MWDNCDNAGVWSPNWALASLQIKAEVKESDIQQIDGGKRHEILANGKIFIPDFLSVQYGDKFSEKSHPHRKALELLKKHDLRGRVGSTLSTTLLSRVVTTLKEEEGEEYKEEEGEEDRGGLGEKLDPEKFPDVNAQGRIRIWWEQEKANIWKDEFWKDVEGICSQIKNTFLQRHDRLPTEDEIYEGFELIINSGNWWIKNRLSFSAINKEYPAIIESIKENEPSARQRNHQITEQIPDTVPV